MSRVLFGVVIALVVSAFALVGEVQPAQAAGGVTGNLRGIVIDAKTAAPVSGANVTAISASGTYRGTTDARGFFAILQMPTDTYTLTISKNGFLPQSISGVTVLGDQSQSLGTIRLAAEARTIGSGIIAHAASSAFSRTRPWTGTTFVGRRVDQRSEKKARRISSARALGARRHQTAAGIPHFHSWFGENRIGYNSTASTRVVLR